MGEELQVTAVEAIGALITLISIILGSIFSFEISLVKNF